MGGGDKENWFDPTVKQLYRPNSCSEFRLREVGNGCSVTQSAPPAFPLAFCKPILAAAENSEAGKELESEGGRWGICFNYPDNCPPPQAIVTGMKQYSIGYCLGLFIRLPVVPCTRWAQSRHSINFILMTDQSFEGGRGCLVRIWRWGVAVKVKCKTTLGWGEGWGWDRVAGIKILFLCRQTGRQLFLLLKF